MDPRTPEDIRRAVLLAVIQVNYDHLSRRKPGKRPAATVPVYVKELRQYLPGYLTKFDLLNAMRFLRAHSFVVRVFNEAGSNTYGWLPASGMDEQVVKTICFEHGSLGTCPKCQKRDERLLCFNYGR